MSDPELTAGDISVADNPERSRYEALLDGQVAGFSAYRRAADRIVFTHTEVDPALEGRGIGSRLARGALDDVRRRGLEVIAYCPFISAYIRRHPEYKDLLARRPGE